MRVVGAVLRPRIDVTGIGNVPATGPAVLVFNHHSYLDFVVLAWAVVVRRKRPVRFLGKREIWNSRWVGWAPRFVDAIPIDRGSRASRAGALDAAIAALRAGDLVVIAPEQTLSASFELLPFRTGAVRMAQRAGAPLIPVVGWGTQRIAAAGIPPRPRFGIPVSVSFGTPVHVDPDEDMVAATERVRALMSRELHRLQASYPDGAPAGAPWVPARLGGGAPDHKQVLQRFHDRQGGWRQPPAAK